MSGRATGDIVAELRERAVDIPLAREAADRLTELDAENQGLRDTLRRPDRVSLRLQEIDALRPPCPTCGDKGFICPDCIDGKVSIERLAKVFAAVWDAGMETVLDRDDCPPAWHPPSLARPSTVGVGLQQRNGSSRSKPGLARAEVEGHGMSEWTVAEIASDQRAAMDASCADGNVGFIQRMRAAHGPTFTHTDHVSERYPNGVVYAGCRCGTVGCSYPRFLLHIEDLRSAYEAKVQDLARETIRSSEAADRLADIAALRPPCPMCGGTVSVIDIDCKCDPEPHDHSYPCPDCIDGKVPIERLVKVFEAVHGEDDATRHMHDAFSLLEQLRGRLP